MDNTGTLGHAKMWTTNLNWQERLQVILLRLPSRVCGRQLLVRQLTSGNFSGRPFSPPAFTCRSHSHQPSKSLSTWCRAPPIAKAATQQKTAQNSSSKLIWSSLWDMKTTWKLIFQLEPELYPASNLRTMAHSASMSSSQMHIEIFSVLNDTVRPGKPVCLKGQKLGPDEYFGLHVTPRLECSRNHHQNSCRWQWSQCSSSHRPCRVVSAVRGSRVHSKKTCCKMPFDAYY